MIDLINKIQETFPNVEDNTCQENNIKINLGSELKMESIILKVDKCKSIDKIQREIEGYKKCDCIIISIFRDIIYLNIIELKTNTRIEERFEERFINCDNKFNEWFSESFREEGIKYEIQFFCVFRRNSAQFIKFIKSINNRLTIRGKRKYIEPIKTESNLSEFYNQNGLFIQ